MSAVSILSGTSEAYVFGTHFFLTNIGHITGTIVSLAFIIPTFYKLKSVSVYKVSITFYVPGTYQKA